MGRRRLLQLTLLSALVAGLVLVPAAAASACPPELAAIGECPSVTGSIQDNAAVLNGTQPGRNGSGPSSGNSSGSGTSTETPPPPPPSCEFWGSIELDTCRSMSAASLPVPALSDIALFRPTPGVDHMEPDGWFVVGLDANFYATGGSSVVAGELFGYPAWVRFTPIRWQWAYGDGSSATKATRGGTWASQGIAEFDPTPTSHVYTVPGTYYIDLTIGYRAEYSYNGSSFAAITGTLWLPANRLVATVGAAKTVLVERDCTALPSGPGCSN